MLKINKILSKKIKSPLSLRGLFPFCHSRESGNPSSPSLREAKQRSNLSGFSLIELMVAIVILALAILGIFQAYSTGFMGMADARDRTVATNYLQEMIEDFKNMDFNQVKSEPITPLPDTKFSRGAYVLNLEVIDEVVTLKKVIAQVRWIDRKGNIKTEKVSTTIYNKPTTSVVSGAARIIIYADPYYTILPSFTEGLNIIAEIKDENGNTVYGGDITFSIITSYDPNDPNDAPVGYIYNPGRTKDFPVDTGTASAPNGIANVKFYPFTVADGKAVDVIERIQASANLGGPEDVTDTVNIRVTTGPVGILLVPEPKEDKKVPAGETVTINLTVVKADYYTSIEYNDPITLSAVGPGTLPTTTISVVPTEGTSFELISTGTPGVVEITASAPGLDIGYTEIIFTGEPASILITPEKKSIYPGENINIIITIVDENNISVEYDGVVNLSADPDYGSFNPNSLNFGSTSLLELESTFTAYTDAPPGKTITLQANSGVLSGSTEITILSSLTPKYLKLFAYPTSFDLFEGVTYPTITATVYDVSGNEIVTTYSTPINFISMKDEISFGSFLPSSSETPIDGEAEVILSSTIAGTTIVTASSGDLILTPEGGYEIVFYKSAHHIELSANPLTIEADGHETSILTATMCDVDGNRVTNYGNDPDNPKKITLSLTEESQGVFINGLRTIELNEFDEGVVTTSLSSTEPGTATVTALSSDGLIDNGFDPYIVLTGDIPSVITLGEVTNLDDYLIIFDITVTGSPIYLNKIEIEWNNSAAPLDQIIIKSPITEDPPLTIDTDVQESPCTVMVDKTLVNDAPSNIGLSFRYGVSKMKQKNIIVTFTDDDTSYVVSFRVPNI